MENQNEEKQKNNKKLILIVAIICVILVIIVGIIIYIKYVNKMLGEVNSTLDDQEEIYGTDRDIDNCKITSIKGVDFELKNTKSTDGEITSDIYINNKLAKNVKYLDNEANSCGEIEIEEIDNNYILAKFASDVVYSDFYLFNKNGKLISDFSDTKGKYDIKSTIPTVQKNDNGGLTIDYTTDNYAEYFLEDAYCDIKPKLTDLYSVVEYVKIENDELKVYDIKKTTWEEQMVTEETDLNEVDCPVE